MKQSIIIAVCFIFLSTVTCTSPPDYPIIPHIDFVSMSKNIMRSGQIGTEDSVYVTLSFTDGDGDLGNTANSPNSLNIFTVNKLYNQPADSFRLPFIPEQGTKNGISGQIRLRLLTSCCKGAYPCDPFITKKYDTLTYDITIKDRANHISNVVTTPPILLQCTK